MKKLELCCNLTPAGECQGLLDLNIGWINFTAIIYVNNEWFHEKNWSKALDCTGHVPFHPGSSDGQGIETWRHIVMLRWRVAFAVLEEFREPRWVYWVSLISAASKSLTTKPLRIYLNQLFLLTMKICLKMWLGRISPNQSFLPAKKVWKKEDKKRSKNTTTKILLPEI